MRKTTMAVLTVTLLLLQGCTIASQGSTSVISDHKEALAVARPDRIKQTVVTLAGDDMGGRRAGTRFSNRAADWIAAQFEEIGLQPAGTTNYLAPFTLAYAEHSTLPHLSLTGASGRDLRYRDDFAASLPSGTGDVEAEVVFVGYAMVAPETNYDDFAGVDLQGKIALVVRGAPGVGAETNPNYRSAQVKDANVAAHGGIGILYVANPREHRGDELQRKHSVMAPVTLPAVEVSQAVAAELVGQNVNLTERIREIDRTRKPNSFATGRQVRLRTQVEVDYHRKDHNVLGLLPGTDPARRDHVLIVSAHYDHMGTDPDNAIFHGAYDNAGGVATMLEVARILAVDPPRFSVLFAAWGAEESGMVGSAAYRDGPNFDAERLVGVINLDSIGYSEVLRVELSRTDKGAAQILDIGPQFGITCKEVNSLGPSDGMTFSKLPVPVIQLVDEGSMDQIHTLDDLPEMVKGDRLAQIAQMVAAQAWWWSSNY